MKKLYNTCTELLQDYLTMGIDVMLYSDKMWEVSFHAKFTQFCFGVDYNDYSACQMDNFKILLIYFSGFTLIIIKND